MPRRVVAAAAAAVLMVLAVQFCDLAVVTRRSSSQNAERRTEPTRGSHNSAEQLQPPRHQWRQQQQPGQLQQQHQPQQDVLVAIASPLDWWMRGGSRDWREPNCTLDDAPLGCRFVHLATGPGAGPASFNDSACAVLAAADAHLWHRCPPTPTQRAAAACGRGSGRPTVLMSAESSVNYPCMNDAGAMAAGSVDIEMSYRRCAQVWRPYYGAWSEGRKAPLARLLAPPLPFEQKLDALLYVNSNCEAKNGRQLVVRALAAALAHANSSLVLHSFGACDPNMAPAELEAFRSAGVRAKQEYARRYKFCVAMENSNDHDYVSEKVFHALEAGCVPLYLGAPNAASFLPDAAAAIDVSAFVSMGELAAELGRLAADRAAYEERLAWKARAPDDWQPSFQQLIHLSEDSPKCRLCALLARHRAAPQRYTPCTANTSWQAEKAAALSTTDGPGGG